MTAADLAVAPLGVPGGLPPVIPPVVVEHFTRGRRQRATDGRQSPAGGQGATDAPVVPEGGRDSYLTSLAGSMRKRGMTEREIGAALAAVNADRCQPPLDTRDVERIAWSVSRYDAADPILADVVARLVAPGSDEPGGDVSVRRIADVKRERIDWLWKGRLALGKVSILDGDPDMGKSTILLDLAARVTRQTPMPDGAPSPLTRPRGVLLLAASEDGAADTIRPRLEAAGADLQRVALVDGVKQPDGSTRPLELPGDGDRIRAIVREWDVALIVIDATMAILPADVNSYRDQDVRRAMHPLAELADECGAAVVMNRHFTKATSSSAIHRGGGSVAFIGVARVGMAVVKDPEDPTGVRRLLTVPKCNLVRDEDKQSTVYTIVGATLTDPDGSDFESSRIEWHGSDPRRADELLREASRDDDERDSGREAEEAILDALACKGALTGKDLERVVTDEYGVGRHRFEAARGRLKRAGRIDSFQVAREDGKRGRGPVSWCLPAEPSEGPGEQIPLSTPGGPREPHGQGGADA